MKKLVIAVIFEHELSAGGNYSQSLNNVLLSTRLEDQNTTVKIITTNPRNIPKLNEYGIEAHLYTINFFSYAWMKLRCSVPYFIYRILRRLEGKNHIEKFLQKAGVDLVYFVSQSGFAQFLEKTNYLYTLFDLCHRDQPEFPEVSKFRAFENRERAFTTNLARSVGVFVDSEIGKTNAIFRYRLDCDRVHVLPFSPSVAISSAKIGNIFDVKKRYELPCDYVFYPAQFWPHKNHVYILEALKRLEQNRGIIVGAIFAGGDRGNMGYIKDCTKKMQLEKRVIFAGFVSNEELATFYLQSLALVMPTFFGPTNLPPLEAFRLGVPVLYSDLKGLRDQVNNAALLLDLTDPESLSSKLHELIESQHLRRELVDKGYRFLESIDSDNARLIVFRRVIEEYRIRRACWE